jgi:hypothetical protein
VKFEKGNTYGKGRKVGSKNKSSELLRQSILTLVSNNMESLQSDLDVITPHERIRALIDLTKYVLPTLKTTEIKENIDSTFTPIVISHE